MKWIKKLLAIWELLFPPSPDPEDVRAGYEAADKANTEAAESEKKVIEAKHEEEEEENKKKDIDELQGEDTY